jgi:hypothetical protein
MRSLAAFGSILRSALFAVIDTEGVEGTADHVVSHAGKVPDSAATNEHDGVLLKVVTLTADVGRDFLAVGESHTGDLTQRGVGFLRGDGSHLKAYATLLRGRIEVTALGLGLG